MDYNNENGYYYTQPAKTKKSALPVICTILCVLLVFSLASTAAVTVLYLRNTANTQSIEEIK